jgi:hypothetical protein
MDDTKGLAIAFEEAQASYDEGGIPVRRGYIPKHPLKHMRVAFH